VQPVQDHTKPVGNYCYTVCRDKYERNQIKHISSILSTEGKNGFKSEHLRL